ncbi:MAG: DUF6385 domain-containing protein [Bacillota bacterium]|nr:DUF6385 domain-containing protein [Bacillota bacterium]
MSFPYSSYIARFVPQIVQTIKALGGIEIRDLTAARDSVLAYGQDGTGTNHPLRTDASGRLEVGTAGIFREDAEAVTTTNAWLPATTHFVGDLASYSFFVTNTGANTGAIDLEYSGDGVHWVNPGSFDNVNPGSTALLEQELYAKYVRVLYKSTLIDLHTTLVITFNGRA